MNPCYRLQVEAEMFGDGGQSSAASVSITDGHTALRPQMHPPSMAGPSQLEQAPQVQLAATVPSAVGGAGQQGDLKGPWPAIAFAHDFAAAARVAHAEDLHKYEMPLEGAAAVQGGMDAHAAALHAVRAAVESSQRMEEQLRARMQVLRRPDAGRHARTVDTAEADAVQAAEMELGVLRPPLEGVEQESELLLSILHADDNGVW